jgi:phage virion morphogenesis protein
MKIHIEIHDEVVQEALTRLISFGRSPVKAMDEIAFYGENSTRERFNDQRGPDGQSWLPSQRVQQHGGKTLVQDRHLLDSIVSQSGSDSAEWGAGVIYAAIHQFGGEIHAKNAKSLFFRLPDGSARSVKKVTIPPRPYLGFNAEDEANVIDIINRHLAAAVNGS